MYCLLFRPRLPPKRRTSKLLPEGSASPATLSRSRVSIESAAPATSLTEIDEIDERKLTLEGNHDADSLMQIRSNDRTTFSPTFRVIFYLKLFI